MRQFMTAAAALLLSQPAAALLTMHHRRGKIPRSFLRRRLHIAAARLDCIARAKGATGGGSAFGVAPLLLALAVVSAQIESDTLSNIPPTLSGDDSPHARIKHPKSRQAERCTSKCVGTCIRGGAGSPGEGPLNIRRPLVVFKQEFRSRQYCLVECSDICNLIKDGDDGP